MFEFEKITGQGFVNYDERRLTSYQWTETGIKLSILDINKYKDLGKYEAVVTTNQHNTNASIEIKQIVGKSFISLYLLGCWKVIHEVCLYV